MNVNVDEGPGKDYGMPVIPTYVDPAVAAVDPAVAARKIDGRLPVPLHNDVVRAALSGIGKALRLHLPVSA